MLIVLNHLDMTHRVISANQKLVQLVMRGFASHEPSGQYTILYDGEGEVDVGLTEHHTIHDGKGKLLYLNK